MLPSEEMQMEPLIIDGKTTTSCSNAIILTCQRGAFMNK